MGGTVLLCFRATVAYAYWMQRRLEEKLGVGVGIQQACSGRRQHFELLIHGTPVEAES